ncbi:ABC transporter ATP-binding protein [Streptantibioticus ferralitis]|uniref:ABC transporter ATP-binding protein n=1 Tax=Streptantibioticus ferralitis TaxID=236510 RepID=A0ABT5Z2A2_9ACTN|nr:ABC transporter ATP-binding protein [Streptantibioticus ferralitis]MDF2257814.1 ABC transporter ATP-binding protein [Streptantibioticus ferralitis]
MYRLTGVTKRYRRGDETVDALSGVDLVIEGGSQLVIQGPAGGGKTTLLQMLGGLDRPTEGSVELDGTDLARLPEPRLTRIRSESIGFVFRTVNLIPALTALENVETALVPLGLAAAQRRQQAAEALESVGLAEHRDGLPGELSGGQRQRVAVARALVKRPKVLLADEPTGDLDEDARDEVMSLLEGLWRAHGLTFVVVTHDSAIARRAPRLATVRKGRVAVRERGPAR